LTILVPKRPIASPLSMTKLVLVMIDQMARHLSGRFA
jgi:hypothetical protein